MMLSKIMHARVRINNLIFWYAIFSLTVSAAILYWLASM
jgi:hypothetical protein